MPDHKDEEPVEFKVVDRRKFNAEGELRSDAEVERKAQEAKLAAKPAAQEPQASEDNQNKPPSKAAPIEPGPVATTEPHEPSAAPAAGSPVGGIQFEHLVMSLVTQAMLQLGLAARPGDLAPKPDLNAAHETIDVLGILVEKTKGNLTPHEEQLLTGSLSELRLAFVEISRQSAGRIN